MTRDEKVAQIRQQLLDVPNIQEMFAKTMRRLQVASISQMAEEHPDQFDSLYDAVQVMEEELPEPGFPFPTA